MMTGKRIAKARRAKGLSQEQLGAKLGVTSQAVSSWERDEYLPDTKNLAALCETLDLSTDALLGGAEHDWELKPVNFDADHMFTYVRSRAEAKELNQTLQVMNRLRAAHGSQERRSRNGFGTTYMVHPLTMACHVLAMGLEDDDIIAACLAHDMVEDAGIRPEDLPVGERVREAVELVSKNLYDHGKADWEKRYYDRIRENPLACMVKCLDRVNNLNGMADAFSREKMAKYTEETDQYYPELLKVLKDVPKWKNAWWLIRYQMTGMTEAFKRLL